VGDPVEQNGYTWTTTALYLRGNGLIRRSAEFHDADPRGNVGVLTNRPSAAGVSAYSLHDRFDVLRSAQGSAAPQWRPAAGRADAGRLAGRRWLWRPANTSAAYRFS